MLQFQKNCLNGARLNDIISSYHICTTDGFTAINKEIRVKYKNKETSG